MVQSWQKPKYAPFEEQAQQEQGDSTLVVLEAERGAAQGSTEESEQLGQFGESANSFQVDVLENWFKP